jgi:hypothetical protein
MAGPDAGNLRRRNNSVPIAAAKPTNMTNNAAGTVSTANIQLTAERTR